MKIRLLGNCTVLLTSKNSQILLDPYFSNSGNLLFKRAHNVSEIYKDIEHLDGILLSHEHFDHMDIRFLKKFKNKCSIYAPKGAVVSMVLGGRLAGIGDEFSIGDFSITVIQAIHLCPTVGYIIRSEGTTLYFSGDTYYGNFIKAISQKHKIDVAMLPVTSYFPPMTMGIKGALLSLKDLHPKYFIPMHQDLVQRFQHTDSAASVDTLMDKMVSEGLRTELVSLKNGEVFIPEERREIV